MVVFGTELEVEEDHGDFSASNNEDGEHEECEAKDIIVLVHPHG